jgi:hypothetical protein
MRTWIVPSLILLSLVVMLASAQERQFTQRDLEEMFYANPRPSAPLPKKTKPQESSNKNMAQRRTGIKYRIQLSDDGSTVRDVSPSSSFRANDKIRLQVESNTDGYLYVIQKGSSGLLSTLFPYQGMAEGTNQVQRGKPQNVPTDAWFAFDQTPGQEQIILILSATPLQSLPARAIRGGDRYPLPSVVAELSGRVRARELRCFSEMSSSPATPSLATIVVNTNPDKNDLVYAEISLKHN